MNHHDLQLIEIGEKVGAEKERAAVVAWLRNRSIAGDHLADAIKAGEHVKETA